MNKNNDHDFNLNFEMNKNVAVAGYKMVQITHM